jgi:hypothetical protein
MITISASTRTIIWIAAGLAGFVFAVLILYLEKDLTYWIRNRFPRLRGGRPPSKKPMIAWAIFWLAAIVTFLGTAIANFATTREPTLTEVPIHETLSAKSTGQCPLPHGVAQPTDTHLFEATFEDGKKSAFYHEGPGTWEVNDDGSGNMVLQANSSDEDYSDVHFYPDLKNGLIEYRFQLRTYDDNIMGSGEINFHFRFKSALATPTSSTHEPDASYNLAFRPNKRAIVVFADEKLSDWPLLKDGRSAFNPDLTPNKWNCVFVDVRGNVIQVYFNDEPLITAEASPDQMLEAGGLGFAIGPGTEVYFDEVRVWRATP